MEGFIVTKGTKAKTYTGYRCATDDMEVNEGEQFIESLKNWKQEVIVSPVTLDQKRLQLAESFKALPLATRVAFQAVAVTVDSALRLEDAELAVANLETAKTAEGADVELLQSMIDLIQS